MFLCAAELSLLLSPTYCCSFFQQGILSDLFPGVVLPEHDYGKLQAGIEEAILARGLQVRPRLLIAESMNI